MELQNFQMGYLNKRQVRKQLIRQLRHIDKKRKRTFYEAAAVKEEIEQSLKNVKRKRHESPKKRKKKRKNSQLPQAVSDIIEVMDSDEEIIQSVQKCYNLTELIESEEDFDLSEPELHSKENEVITLVSDDSDDDAYRDLLLDVRIDDKKLPRKDDTKPKNEERRNRTEQLIDIGFLSLRWKPTKPVKHKDKNRRKPSKYHLIQKNASTSREKKTKNKKKTEKLKQKNNLHKCNENVNNVHKNKNKVPKPNKPVEMKSNNASTPSQYKQSEPENPLNNSTENVNTCNKNKINKVPNNSVKFKIKKSSNQQQLKHKNILDTNIENMNTFHENKSNEVTTENDGIVNSTDDQNATQGELISYFDRFNRYMVQQLELTVAQQLYTANYLKMNSQSFLDLSRALSDGALQNSSCINTGMNFLSLVNNNDFDVCQAPCPTVTDNIQTKTTENKLYTQEKKPQRSCSVGDMDNAVENYVRNVNSELQRLKNFRKWENTVYGETYQKTTSKNRLFFTLLSYNVLAQILLTKHRNLYKKHDHKALLWNHRKWALMREFQEHNADILCLQEVEKDHLDSFYNPGLNKMGYQGIYKERTGQQGDGCAIYYKDSIFDLVETTSIEYFQRNTDVLDRANIGLVARFSRKDNPSIQFVVATTHLLYNPRRHDVRLAQTQLLLAEIDRLAFDKFENNTEIYVPVIITGDFNSQPNTAAYELLVDGKIVYHNLTSKRLAKPYGENILQGKLLIPPRLGVTDKCQHAGLVQKRSVNSKMLTREEEIRLIKLSHSERWRVTVDQNSNVENAKDFSSGRLTHNLNLKSVYNHQRFQGFNGSEATTHQTQWITVDYIFYSEQVDGKKSKSKLELLSKYRLPTVNECYQLPSIPNLVFGSDHLLLLAKFALTEN